MLAENMSDLQKQDKSEDDSPVFFTFVLLHIIQLMNYLVGLHFTSKLIKTRILIVNRADYFNELFCCKYLQWYPLLCSYRQNQRNKLNSL